MQAGSWLCRQAQGALEESKLDPLFEPREFLCLLEPTGKAVPQFWAQYSYCVTSPGGSAEGACGRSEGSGRDVSWADGFEARRAWPHMI